MNESVNYWPTIISVAANVLMVVISGLIARWISGVVQNVESQIKIAILELEKTLASDYATKEYVDQQMGIVGRLDDMRADVRRLLRVLPGHDTPQPGTTR